MNNLLIVVGWFVSCEKKFCFEKRGIINGVVAGHGNFYKRQHSVPMYNYTLMSSSSSSKVAVPVVKQRSLLLKHEILSPECDLFRACLPRRLFVKRLGRLMALVVVMVVGHWWFRVRDVWVSLLMIVSTLFIIFFMLSQAIEGKVD